MTREEFTEFTVDVREFISQHKNIKKIGEVCPIMYDCDMRDDPLKHPRFYYSR